MTDQGNNTRTHAAGFCQNPKAFWRSKYFIKAELKKIMAPHSYMYAWVSALNI